MLNRSFIFLPGIGPSTERKLWRSGIPDWEAFLGSDTAGPIKGIRKKGLDPLVQDALDHLGNRNLIYFSKLFRR